MNSIYIGKRIKITPGLTELKPTEGMCTAFGYDQGANGTNDMYDNSEAGWEESFVALVLCDDGKMAIGHVTPGDKIEVL